jgi:hypothetical protein
MKKGLDVSEHIIFKIYTSSGLGATLSRHFLSKIKNTAQNSRNGLGVRCKIVLK